MNTLSRFRNIEALPTTEEDVIWSELKPRFHQQCVEALTELTHFSQVATAQSPVSFYVGAGISIFRPSALPAAKDVLSSLFRLCANAHPNLQPYADIIQEALNHGSYVLMENVFQNLSESIHPKPFNAGHIFDVPELPPAFNINHEFLARWLHSGKGSVVTTNLDPLIEHAWRSLNSSATQELKVIKRPDEFQDWRSLLNRSVLWKLHGSANDSESWAITLSKVGFELQDQRSDFLQYLIDENHTVFIGYRAADLDLFPSILKAHENKRLGAPKIFWVFYFDEAKRTLEDYLEGESNIEKLFAANPNLFAPIVTTAESLSAWLELKCFNRSIALSDPNITVARQDFEHWLRQDIESIGLVGCTKLVGQTLRTLGRKVEARKVFDDLAEQLLQTPSAQVKDEQGTYIKIAQLLQESAQTYWQEQDVLAALTTVERAWQLLRKTDNHLERAWCQYGLITMTLDAKHSVTRKKRIIALVQLIGLHFSFWKLSKQSRANNSPILGEGLCLYYETKVVERIVEKTRLLHFHIIAKILVHLYSSTEGLLRKAEFLRSIPDVKRRRAFIRMSYEPNRAVEDMLDAIRIAQVVGDAQYQLAVDRAKELAVQIENEELRKQFRDNIPKN